MIRVKACPVGLLQANCYLVWDPETRKGRGQGSRNREEQASARLSARGYVFSNSSTSLNPFTAPRAVPMYP